MFGFMASQKVVSAPAYAPNNGVLFDGVNDGMYVNRTTDLITTTGSMCSLWIKRKRLTGVEGIISNRTSNIYFTLWTLNAGFLCRLGTSGEYRFRYDYSGTTESFGVIDGWTHFLFSDTGSSFQLYINGVAADFNDPQWTAKEYSPSVAGYYMSSAAPNDRLSIGCTYDGLNNPGRFIHAELQEVYLNTTTGLDFTVSSNLEKFIKDSKPVSLGADGSLPTGSQPEFYFNNPFDSFETNKGSYGNFTVIGALEEGTALP